MDSQDEQLVIVDTEEDASAEEIVSVSYEARSADHVDTAVVEYRDSHGDLHERVVDVHVHDSGSGHADTATADLHGGSQETIVAQDTHGTGVFDKVDSGSGILENAPALHANESRTVDAELQHLTGATAVTPDHGVREVEHWGTTDYVHTSSGQESQAAEGVAEAASHVHHTDVVVVDTDLDHDVDVHVVETHDDSHAVDHHDDTTHPDEASHHDEASHQDDSASHHDDDQ